ncbi:NADP-dependent malic enzyme [uncultured Enorma sp.]|uniref:NAD(P)-dependent malic enzyme n=1 Tax=uncultured Enorma sp. TaxID=1714346 RepID=UPI0026DC824F|nr:malic enzyme-like NAD(P)-binding protein [uncultured Enorma sp.]
MSIGERALEQHVEWHGKIEVVSRAAVETADDLAIAYTPGVAAPCLEIQCDPDLSYTYTRRGNLVAVITDGSAVLGLGNIGPVAGMPVMEGKCALFKSFADIDAFPLCVGTQDVDELVETIRLISGSFGGINLEDISAPRCFEVERRLKEVCDIPIFHDDQHGTAIVASAALINACRLTGRELATARIVFSGAGAAGISIASLMLELGARDIVLCDVDGALYEGKPGMNPAQERIAAQTNPRGVTGSLADALADADVFVGVSVAGVLSQDMVRSMAPHPIVFALANPVPEIMPNEARAAGAAVCASGRSDFPNQINNVLVFPGVFRGALDVRARDISDGMMVAATHAIAGMVGEDELRADYILPSALDKRVVPVVAAAVAEAARSEGLARA